MRSKDWLRDLVENSASYRESLRVDGVELVPGDYFVWPAEATKEGVYVVSEVGEWCKDDAMGQTEEEVDAL